MKYIVGAYATAPSLGNNNDKSIEHKFYITMMVEFYLMGILKFGKNYNYSFD